MAVHRVSPLPQKQPNPKGNADRNTQPEQRIATRISSEHIRATWSGTESVEDAAQAFGMSRSKGYDLVRRGKFPCRVLQIGRAARVVTASLLRVLESGEPEDNGASSASPAPS
ncbi:helix-turn-helix domain-containing protein [Streptomyces sp. NPDC047869]|uniref:helix-turn-helix domain-containing protein n=1 Tax=Streptomyces sp. NPDC047869 TaxID=3154709 RepID=UPI00345340BC